MPPKKQEDNSPPYKPIFVLPILLSSDPHIQEAIRKPVNIKKDIDKAKIIEVLNDKGLSSHIQDTTISKQGSQFICQNYTNVISEMIQAVSKPIDPKKDPKKDAKKDSKKQQVVPETTPPIQFNFDKKCNDFYFLLDFPENGEQLEKMLHTNVKIDIVLIIKEKIKPGSKKPDYSLLRNQRSTTDLQATLNNTQLVQKNNESSRYGVDQQKKKLSMIEHLIEVSKDSQQLKSISQTIVISMNYMKNLSNPENDQEIFLNSLYSRLCQLTLDQQVYEKWKSEQTICPMIEPIKTTVTKEVQVESQDKGKKGGKGEPTFETVEEVVETKYESYPQNIKVKLDNYHIAKRMILTNNKKLQENPFQLVLEVCMGLISQQNSSEEEKKAKVDQIRSKIRDKYDIKPINKVTPKILSKNVREISYPKMLGNQSELKFDYKPQEAHVSLMQLSQKATMQLQSLKTEYLIKKIEEMVKKQKPFIKWDFSDRKYQEKFTANQINAVINRELLNDPDISSGILEIEGTKLLVTIRMNPPGRILYHNNIFDWKVIPDFQNWLNNKSLFVDCPQGANRKFLDYENKVAGNLSICSKNMMPRDNSIIKDIMWTIGCKKQNVLQVCKNQSRFGITKHKNPEELIVYWHQLDDQYLIRCNRIQRKKLIPKQKAQSLSKQDKVKQSKQGDQNQNINQQEKQVENEIMYEPSINLYIENKGQYIISNDPYPTIFWSKQKANESKRSFGPMGQITSFKKDGSITIMYPNGNTSTYRNGLWTKIVGDTIITREGESKIKVEEMIEGQIDIRIREDQTILVEYPNHNKKILFPDQTEIYYDAKYKTREIKWLYGPIMRIHLPRQNNLNIIGYGSAFAYLGFKDILERSYDGYLFELFDSEISSHYYLENYDIDGKIHSQYMRLITFKDSSMIRIECNTGKAIYLSANQKTVLTEQYMNERWLQLYTTKQNHLEGVFDIDLVEGTIETKDSETNHFIAKLNNPSEAKIAVSFVKEEEEQDEGRKFGNGFHVKKQNYFLPPPPNMIPPRIFAIHNDGGGVQYLNQSQLGDMELYKINEQYRNEKIIRQYTLEVKEYKDSYLQSVFTKGLSLDKFGLPEALAAQKTKKTLVPYQFPGLKHRVIEQISWNSDYSRVSSLSDKITSEKKNRQEKLVTLKTVKA